MNKEKKEFAKFTSPTHGRVSFKKMMEIIHDFFIRHPHEEARLIIGTDSPSPVEGKLIDYYTVVVAWSLGHGGIYFYTHLKGSYTPSLKERISQEAGYSLALANFIQPDSAKTRFPECKLSIDVDIGENGETREIIKAILGMIKGSGFEANHKPDTVACRVAHNCKKTAFQTVPVWRD